MIHKPNGKPIKKVAVVGAGIYGCTIASILADYCEVHLFEINKKPMLGASMVNQYRLHRGYHYPRSQETVEACLKSEVKFKSYYDDTIISNNHHYYAIAKEKSKTTSSDFERFCKSNNLFLKKESLNLINIKAVESVFNVKESLIDPKRLFQNVSSKLSHPNIKLHFEKKVFADDIKDFDEKIICTYSQINSLIDNGKRKEYQFEVCEKILAKLSPKFNKKSIVIMDGPFMCLDPYGHSEYHLLGNVNEAIHETNIGYTPIISKKLTPYINKGLISNRSISKFDRFIETAIQFLPDIATAEYISSMFTVRSVLPNKDKTDERPVIVNRVDDKTITVFAGKISNCIDAAETVLKMISPNQ